MLELNGYLNSLHQQCPDTRIVLAGYSQGAQVIGESLKVIMPDIQKKIDFVALFGDPKLHLPEGNGLFAPACFGKDYSPWRRTIGNCYTSGGSLGARADPYIPRTAENKTGLWCLKSDFICGSSRSLTDNSGHKRYADKNSSIDEAVLEIARILKTSLPKKPKPPTPPSNPIPAPEPEPIIDVRPFIDNVAGADVMFVMDNSPSMAPLRYNNTIKNVITNVTEKVLGSGGRVGMITYCACNPTSRVYHTPLKEKTSSWHPIYHILSGYEHDRPAGNLSASLKDTIKHVQATEQWHTGARRIIVPITNNEHAPPIVQAQVKVKPRAMLASTTSGTSIYPIVPAEIANSFKNLSIPGARVANLNPTSMEELSVKFINQLEAQLVAKLASEDYYAPPGQTIYFDASRSQVYEDEITKYEWDFNGDNVYDLATTLPQSSYTYMHEFSGKMSVKISSKNGLESTATATVTITSSVPVVAKAPKNLQVQSTANSTATLKWEAGDTLATSWLISIDGIHIGQTAKSQLSVTIGDLDRTQKIIFGVQAVTKDSQVGDRAEVTLHPGENYATSPTSGSQPAVPSQSANSDSINLSADTHKNIEHNSSSDKDRSPRNPKWLLYAGIGALVALITAGLLVAVIRLYRSKQQSTI